MSKLKTRNPLSTESTEDDIAGLFNRLGVAGSFGAYQDFSDSRLGPEPRAGRRIAAVPSQPAPAPAAGTNVPAEPAAAAPEVLRESVPTALAAPSAAASAVQVHIPDDAGCKKTPLEQLFQRLLDAKPAGQLAPDASPLGKLRGY